MASQIDNELAVAQRHIIEGEQRSARQKALIEELRLAGRDMIPAEIFLATLEQSLAVMQQHLRILLAEQAGLL